MEPFATMLWMCFDLTIHYNVIMKKDGNKHMVIDIYIPIVLSSKGSYALCMQWCIISLAETAILNGFGTGVTAQILVQFEYYLALCAIQYWDTHFTTLISFFQSPLTDLQIYLAVIWDITTILC
jgi:hypothetical protein